MPNGRCLFVKTKIKTIVKFLNYNGIIVLKLRNKHIRCRYWLKYKDESKIKSYCIFIACSFGGYIYYLYMFKKGF